MNKQVKEITEKYMCIDVFQAFLQMQKESLLSYLRLDDFAGLNSDDVEIEINKAREGFITVAGYFTHADIDSEFDKVVEEIRQELEAERETIIVEESKIKRKEEEVEITMEWLIENKDKKALFYSLKSCDEGFIEFVPEEEKDWNDANIILSYLLRSGGTYECDTFSEDFLQHTDYQTYGVSNDIELLELLELETEQSEKLFFKGTYWENRECNGIWLMKISDFFKKIEQDFNPTRKSSGA